MSVRPCFDGYEPEYLPEYLPPTGYRERAEPEYYPEYVNAGSVIENLCRALDRTHGNRPCFPAAEFLPPRLSLIRFLPFPVLQCPPQRIIEPTDDLSAARPLAAQTAQDAENLCWLIEMEGYAEIDHYVERIGRAYRRLKRLLRLGALPRQRPVQLKLI